MMPLGWRLLSAGLLMACLASFSWAMRNFFSRPAGVNAGVKVIAVCSAGFAVLHLGAIMAALGGAGQALAAASLYVLALALFWWAIRANSPNSLSAAFSPDCPLHLVQGGPYRLVRHPFYCAYLLTWTAGIVAAGRLWLVPTVAVMWVVYLRAARMEEDKFARSPLAAAYQRYRSRTGMFFPNPFKSIVARKKDVDAAGLAQYRA